MLLPRYVVSLVVVSQILLGAGSTCGQTTSTGSGQAYPNKPIRMVTGGVGSGNDYTSRVIAQGIAGPLGQQVIVDNRPSGVIVVEAVSKAPPDGYTLLLYSDGLWILPLMQKVPYDPVKDFSPIMLVSSTPNVLVVHPSLPVKSVKELIVLAKAKPGELNFGTSVPSASSNLAAELFKLMAGVNIVSVPYKSSAGAVISLIGGEVQLVFATAPSVTLHVKSGKLRALAVTSANPSALAPGLPTVAASGVPGYESKGTMYGLFAPSQTATTIIGRLNREIVLLLNGAEAKEQLLRGGLEPVAGSPEHMASTMASEMIRMGKVIKDAGIRTE